MGLWYVNSFHSISLSFVIADGCLNKTKRSNNKSRKRQERKRQPAARRNSFTLTADDDLDSRVAALPKSVTNRFGELCWAQGGSGYSWWPSMIFDPRRTEEPARGEGNRYLGVKYLVYFLECPETPFSCLYSRQIKPWFDGYYEDLHLGKAAKATGKQRHIQFQRALLVANHAVDLSPDIRMDLDSLTIVRSPKRKKHAAAAPNKIVTRKRAAKSESPSDNVKQDSKRRRSNKPHEDDPYASDESKLMCKIVLKRIEKKDQNVGMVFLSSLKNTTFSSVRREIEKDLCGDLLPKELDWRFYLPETRLPVSKRQESSLGPFYKILLRESDGSVGTGTFKDPIQVYIAEA